MYLFDIFVTRIAEDFRQKELLPLKVLFFVHASTLFVLYPYLTIHMRELGINVEETAIMSAVTPIVAIVMPPIAGMVADRIGNFKILLAIFSALGGGASLLLLLVPVGRITITYPEKVVFDIGCGDLPHVGMERFLDLSFAHDQPCDFLPSLMQGKTHQVNSTLEACGFMCKPTVNSEVIPGPTTSFQPNVNSRNVSNLILMAHRYDVIVINPLNSNVTESYSYILTALQNPNVLSTTSVDNDLRNLRIKKNKEFYQTSVRLSTNNSYFFPTTGLYNLACEPMNESSTQDVNENNRHNSVVFNCTFGKGTSLRDGVSRMHFLKEIFLMDVFHLASSDIGSKDFKTFLVKGLNKLSFKESEKNVTKVFNASCNDVYSQNGYKISISVQLHDPEKSTEVDRIVQLSECRPRCLVTIPRAEICSNLKREEVYNMGLTFWSYLAVRVFIGMIGGTAFAMFEGAVIAILREQNADYGLQRIYATIGGMISSPLSGLLIDYASQGKGYSDFRPAFYLYATLKILSGFLMLTINLEFKPPAKNVISDVYSVLKNVEIVALFIAIFVLGTAWGYIESFLFWLLQDLGGTRTLMGFTITVGGIAGIPLLILSGPIIDKIGHANVLFIGFIFYAMRLVGYSLIYNPWLCLIFEAMESVTSSLSFTAAVTYAAKLSTTTTDSSIQGLLGGIYFGVGKGAGSLIGGYTMKAFGTRPTYRIFAVACTITGVVYFIFNKFYLRKQPQVEGNDIIKKTDSSKPKEKKKMDAVDNGKEKEIIEMHVNNNFNASESTAPSATITGLESNNSSSINIERSEKSNDKNENHKSEDLPKRDNAQSRSLDDEENKEKTSAETS